MSKAIKLPCVIYESTVDHQEFETVKLEQTFADGSVKKKQVPIFSGKHGVEGLLHVVDRFQRAARKLAFDAEDNWDNFEEVLDDTAEKRWTNLTGNLTDAQKTAARFIQEVNRFVMGYAGGTTARDDLHKYLRTSVRKPKNVSPQEHADRVETLCRYSNTLPGTEPELTEAQTKNIIFETFPTSWQKEYLKKNTRIGNQTIADIVDYMDMIKGFTDGTENNKRKSDDNNNNNTDNRNGNEKKKKKQKTGRGGAPGKPKPDDRCPFHHTHKWKQCFDNPNGESFRPSRGQNHEGRGQQGGRGRGRGGGRGGGRGYDNRGGTAGRGGFHSNRGGYNSGYQGGNNGGEQHYNNHYFDGPQNNGNPGWTQQDQYHYDQGQGFFMPPRPSGNYGNRPGPYYQP